MNVSLGQPIPPHTPHAISVSLPTWRDNVGYEEGETRVVNSQVSGYPRFFIHLSIVKLASICEQKYAIGGERCMLFPTRTVAEECRSFIQRRSELLGSPVTARIVQLSFCPDDDAKQKWGENSIAGTCADLYVVLFPGTNFSVAKEFWQHAGMGISSRLAEKCLSLLPQEPTVVPRPASPVSDRFLGKGYNRHYSAVKAPCGKPATGSSPQSPKFSAPSSTATTKTAIEDFSPDHSVYLEERYGRNLPQSAASFAKKALRSRVAGVLKDYNCQSEQNCPSPTQPELVIGPSARGVTNVAPEDVYLYPCGMAAIWNAHHLALTVRPPSKSICFGFPYTDTLKILQKWGPGCHFLGFGLDSDIDELEKILEDAIKADPNSPPALALFTEFPSNPLLRSANLPRLRALADKYDFLIIIDETIGNFVNVEVLPYADILVSSLTKIFSGASNVMGGGLVLNPQGRHYTALKTALNDIYEDLYFDEDAIYMERNSRDFQRRVRVIDTNAEVVCDYLRSRSVANGQTTPPPAIKEVFYPKFTTRENYDHCRIKATADSENEKAGGFGGLFSLTFMSEVASKAFFDALPSYKGPSLGTNFTLACPYTILAHYTELDWAAQYGVEAGLVRISVGMEDTRDLLKYFQTALEAAEAVTSA